MTEMIDRVARAIFSADFNILSWEDASPRTRTAYIGKAALVIRAMREPTEAMAEAGFKMLTTTLKETPDVQHPHSSWRAMIDAALRVSTASRSEAAWADTVRGVQRY